MSKEKDALQKNKEELEANIDPLTKLLVSDVLNKNNVTEDKKRNLSEAQKQAIITMVNDLQKQANEFVERVNKKKADAEKAEQEAAPQKRRRTTLRDRVRQRKNDNI